MSVNIYNGTNLDKIAGKNPLPDLSQMQANIANTMTRVSAIENNVNWLTGLRFKNLGTSFTSAQQQALAAGDFSDFWNGDYWVINNITWRIVDNTGMYRHRGDTEFNLPSLVIFPDDPLVLPEEFLIDDADKDSEAPDDFYHGYFDCAYRTRNDGKGKAYCKTVFENAFGSSHIASRREIMTRMRIDDPEMSPVPTVQNGWTWSDADVELPNEFNITGTLGYSSFTTKYFITTPSFNVASTWGQWKLYQLAPYMAINRTYNYWLRDTYLYDFARISRYGSLSYAHPSVNNIAIRPYAVIIGQAA